MKSSIRARLLTLSGRVVLASWMVCGCAPAPQTEVVVFTSTNLARGSVLRSVRVVAQRRGATAPLHDQIYDLSNPRLVLPSTVVIVARDPDDARPLTVRVIGDLGSRSLEQGAEVRFQRDRTLYLHMSLASECLTTTCEPSQTCRLGRCERPDQAVLTEASPSMPLMGDGGLGIDDIADAQAPDDRGPLDVVATSDLADTQMNDERGEVPDVSAPDVSEAGMDAAGDAQTDVPPDLVTDLGAALDSDAMELDSGRMDALPVDTPDAGDVMDGSGDALTDVADVSDASDAAMSDAVTDAPTDVSLTDLSVPETCPSGSTPCPGGCVDTSTSLPHCGGCGRACSIPNASAECAFGSCAFRGCNTGFLDCDSARPGCETDPTTDPTRCGACNTVCPAVLHGAPTCVAARCGVSCEAGYVERSGACLPDYPRPIAPLSGTFISGSRPTLRWQPLDGSTETLVRICRDRACNTVVESQTVTANSAVSMGALAPGRYFWSLAGRRTGGFSPASPPWQFAISGTTTTTAPVGLYPDYNGDGAGDLVIQTEPLCALLLFAGSSSGFPGTATQRVTVPNSVSFSGGRAPVYLGDVNGDGYTDLNLFCGARGDYVLHGGPSGLTLNPTATGQEIERAAGDFDGDGYGDVITTDRMVIYGSPDGLRFSGARTRLALPTDGSAGSRPTGRSSMGGADLNGDGAADLVVGNSGFHGTSCAQPCQDCGRALIYLGQTGVRPTTLPAGIVLSRRGTTPNTLDCSGFGESVAWLDANADGRVDVAVGDPSYVHDPGMTQLWWRGRVSVFFGSGGSIPAAASQLLDGVAPMQFFGRELTSLGDVTGDGSTDLIVYSGGAANRSELFVGGPSGYAAARRALTGVNLGVGTTGPVDDDSIGDFAATRGMEVTGGYSAETVFYRGASTPALSPAGSAISGVLNNFPAPAR